MAEDTQRLMGVMRDMRLALEQAQGLRIELESEGAEKAALQRALNESQVSGSGSQARGVAQDSQVAALRGDLLRTRAALDKALAEHGAFIRAADASTTAYEGRIEALQGEVLGAKEEKAVCNAQMQHMGEVCESQKQETAAVLAQLRTAVEQRVSWEREAKAASEEVLRSREAMQVEYQSMFANVRELGSLDALKDESVREVLADRDRAILQRDEAMQEMAGAEVRHTDIQTYEH